MPIENGEGLIKGQAITYFSKKVVPFMFNPTSVPRVHGWSWTKQKVPGRSHPFIGGGAGTDESYVIDLWLDADRGRAANRKYAQANAAINTSFSVMGILNDFYSMTLPYDRDLGNSHGVPEPVMLDMGEVLPSLLVVVDKVTEKRIFFTKKMEPMKASIKLSFTLLELSNSTSWKFLSANPSEHIAPDAGQRDTASLGGSPLIPGLAHNFGDLGGR